MIYDAIIIGSGPAGTFAALGLENKNVLMLDVGHDAEKLDIDSGSLWQHKQIQTDLFDLMIGQEFQGLSHLHQTDVGIKLKAPLFSHVVKNWQTQLPLQLKDFKGVVSYAKGGWQMPGVQAPTN